MSVAENLKRNTTDSNWFVITGLFWFPQPRPETVGYELFDAHRSTGQQVNRSTGQQGGRVADVLTGLAAVHREAAPLAHEGLAEAGASAQHLAGVRVAGPGHDALSEAAAGRPDGRIHRQGGRLTGVGHSHQPLT